jgi:hypothetical protein
MGARPEQQLALNFLVAVHRLWLDFPGSYVVEESTNDLVAALAQTCIKALAADVRDGSSVASQRATVIDGRIVDADGTEVPINLREVVNKIIHGSPTLVVVTDGVIRLHFSNNKSGDWIKAWFSATQVLDELNRELYKHPPDEREDEISLFLQELGPERFLPTAAHADPDTAPDDKYELST